MVENRGAQLAKNAAANPTGRQRQGSATRQPPGLSNSRLSPVAENRGAQLAKNAAAKPSSKSPAPLLSLANEVCLDGLAHMIKARGNRLTDDDLRTAQEQVEDVPIETLQVCFVRNGKHSTI